MWSGSGEITHGRETGTRHLDLNKEIVDSADFQSISLVPPTVLSAL